MENSLQSKHIVVIYDLCSDCGKIVAVLRSGYLDNHKTKLHRRNITCIGSGSVASAVVKFVRAEKKRAKEKERNTEDGRKSGT